MLSKDDLLKRRAQLSPQLQEVLQRRLRGERGAPAAAGAPQAGAIPQRATHGPVPLSFGQHRLWFLDQLAPHSPFYNIAEAVRLTGAVTIAALQQSIGAVVQRHATLRTTFSLVEDTPMQFVAPAAAVPLVVIDLRHVPERSDAASWQRLLTQVAQQPFDLPTGPLLRTTLFRLGEADYVLLLVVHHIIADGWSMGIFVREIAAFYEGFASGQPRSLPPLPIQYADFVAWQHEAPQTQTIAEQLPYWQQQLDGDLPPLDLPTDRPRPAVLPAWGALHRLAIQRPLTDALHHLSQQASCTLFMTLLAAWQVLLSRYSRQEQLFVGVPIAGRTRVEIEGLIGFFVNTLVLRADLSGQPTFQELLARARAVTLGAYAHQDMPFEKLVQAMQPARDLSRAPLFQVMCILQNTPTPQVRQADMQLSHVLVDTGTAKFELTLMLSETADGLTGAIEYNTTLFVPETIARLASQLQRLLEGVVADPERRIGELELLSQAEQQQLVVEWNATRVDYAPDVCLHQLVAAQATRTPDAVALAFEGQQLSYRVLDARANQLAHALQQQGVGPESRVGLCMERSLELVLGLLGVLKAGGAYVPLDPAYPQERLAFMLADAGVALLLTATTDDRRPTTDDRPTTNDDRPTTNDPSSILDLCVGWPAIAAQPESAPASAVIPSNLAYVIYTSGSTGRPKGAMNTHRAIVNRLRWMQDAYQLSPTDRVLQKTTFSFDVSVWEFFWPLLCGASLVLARPDGHRDSAYLIELIAQERITTLHFVPSMLQVFLEERGLEQCINLCRVICSGEALAHETQERFFSRLDAELHNLYGPTEAAVDVTAWACTPASGRHSVPIGRPIANTQIYLLDPHMQPVPVGVAGELYIGGVQLARGYLSRPDLTAERFVPNPFLKIEDRGLKIEDSRADASEMQSSILYPLSSESDRLYRTGDLARYLPDGALEFMGRTDQQVKVRGFRIELGEIEEALARHPQVQAAAVVLRADAPGEKRLVAYVVPTTDHRPLPLSEAKGPTADRDSSLVTHHSSLVTELRAFLKDKLPDYMVPAAFVVLDALPLTSNGKLDRRALAALALPAPSLETAFVAPRSPTEGMLAQIWAEVLRLEQVGIHDNFFALGGHSLLATQAVVRMAQVFAQPLALRTLFEKPTIADLALLIDQQQPSAATAPPPTLVRVARSDRLVNRSMLKRTGNERPPR